MAYPAIQQHPRFRLHAAVDLLMATAEIEQTTAENISLGGIFVRTMTPPPMASVVRLRLRPSEESFGPIGLMGRVVHIVDNAAAAARAVAMGVGVQFDALPPLTEAELHRLIETLAARQDRERAATAPAHFSTSAVVQVQTPRPILQNLWAQGLEHGLLMVAGVPPPPGSVVKVYMGPIECGGEVLQHHLDDSGVIGAAVMLNDFEGAKRTALLNFLEERSPVLFFREGQVDERTAAVLAAVRRLFVGIDDNDPFGGVSLRDDASEADVRVRVEQLRRVFRQPPPDVTPPQRARIDSAARALEKLEPVLLGRARARALAERIPSRVFPRGSSMVDPDAVVALLHAAGDHERQGRLLEARRALESALELAPDDADVQQRLTSVEATINLARAVELVGQARVVIDVGMKDKAIEQALEAARLSSRREVRLPAVRVLAMAGDLRTATTLAEEILDADHTDPHALQALMILHEKTERWRDALKMGEALLRLKPDDKALQKRVKKIADNARREPGTAAQPIPSGRWSFRRDR